MFSAPVYPIRRKTYAKVTCSPLALRLRHRRHRLLHGLPVVRSSIICALVSGEPDVERYTATNDIGLTVEYGSDGLACQIVIERKQPLLLSDQGGNICRQRSSVRLSMRLCLL